MAASYSSSPSVLPQNLPFSWRAGAVTINFPCSAPCARSHRWSVTNCLSLSLFSRWWWSSVHSRPMPSSQPRMVTFSGSFRIGSSSRRGARPHSFCFSFLAWSNRIAPPLTSPKASRKSWPATWPNIPDLNTRRFSWQNILECSRSAGWLWLYSSAAGMHPSQRFGLFRRTFGFSPS